MCRGGIVRPSVGPRPHRADDTTQHEPGVASELLDESLAAQHTEAPARRVAVSCIDRDQIPGEREEQAERRERCGAGVPMREEPQREQEFRADHGPSGDGDDGGRQDFVPHHRVFEGSDPDTAAHGCWLRVGDLEYDRRQKHECHKDARDTGKHASCQHVRFHRRKRQHAIAPESTAKEVRPGTSQLRDVLATPAIPRAFSAHSVSLYSSAPSPAYTFFDSGS